MGRVYDESRMRQERRERGTGRRGSEVNGVRRSSRAFLRELEGYALRAADGEIGKVVDSLFDDVEWIVRHLVVSTGPSRWGSQVLIARTDCRYADSRARTLVTDLTREEVADAPAVQRPARGTRPAKGASPEAGPQLRSAREVTGYTVRALDRDVGQIADLLALEDMWTIEHLVVETGSWLSSHKILVPRSSIDRADWPERTVTVSESSQSLEDRVPVYDPAAAIKRTFDE